MQNPFKIQLCEDSVKTVLTFPLRVRGGQNQCAPEHSGAVSLGEQVDHTFRRVHENDDAYSLLESKLMRYGFIDLPEYREQKYVCSGEMHFRVDADFPRLTSDNVVPQIIEVQYSISLASIEDWRVEG